MPRKLILFLSVNFTKCHGTNKTASFGWVWFEKLLEDEEEMNMTDEDEKRWKTQDERQELRII